MPTHPLTTTVPVRTASRSYDVVIGEELLTGSADRIIAAVGGARLVQVFVDEGLPPTVAGDLARRLALAGLRVSATTVRVSESAKSLQSLYHMVQQLAEHNLERRDAVIALGGGITGDMAGFAAATYRRGIPWINCPTTLLAMVDASVGGKTGVNLRVGNRGGEGGGGELQKNMVGAFWQPSLVLADVSTLSTLPDRTFRAGLAECIKHGMIAGDLGGWADEHLLHWTKTNLGQILARDPATLTELIARNVAVKARVVGTDEREESTDPAGGSGGRALLNLGHTFAHAIETLPQVAPGKDPLLAPLQHGEAVALGLICASRCAELLKLVGEGLTESVRRTLEHAGLPVVAHALPGPHEIYERMLHDKKSAGGKLRLVLPCAETRAKLVTAPDETAVLTSLDAIRA